MSFNINTQQNKTRKKSNNTNDQNGKNLNLINQKILDAILDDNDEVFNELISQNFSSDANPNKVFSLPNYKFPKILQNNPTYASLCSFLSAKKCLNSLSVTFGDLFQQISSVTFGDLFQQISSVTFGDLFQ